MVSHLGDGLVLIERIIGTGRQLARGPVEERRVVARPDGEIIHAVDEHLVALLILVVDRERHGNGRRKFNEVEACGVRVQPLDRFESVTRRELGQVQLHGAIPEAIETHGRAPREGLR